jgi:hypothetical protein
MQLDVHKCGFMDFYFYFGETSNANPGRDGRDKKRPSFRLLSAAVGCCRIFEGGRGGGKFQIPSSKDQDPKGGLVGIGLFIWRENCG